MQMRTHKLLPALCAFALSFGCDKGKNPDSPTPSTTKAPAGPNTNAAPNAAADTSGGSAPKEANEPVTGGGTVVVVGDTPVQELELAPYSSAPDGGAAIIKPDAKGRVKAGIYKVPGGSYIAVPEGGTVHVRPEESRGVMVGGLPFQLDTEVEFVGEADPEGLSFTRVESTEPGEMPRYGPRYLKPGVKVEGRAILEHRDFIHQLVLHSDLTADSNAAFREIMARDLSDHFLIDFDGTLYQTLDVAAVAYHGGEANLRSISVTLNNLMRNLEREPNAKAYPPVLTEGTSLTPPADAQAFTGPCKLVAGKIGCEVKGMAFGLGDDTTFVIGDDIAFLTRSNGEDWARSVAPFGSVVPNGLRMYDGSFVAYGAAGKVAVSADAGATWRQVDSGVKATWRDAWGESYSEDGPVIVLVGDRGQIARSTDEGMTFTVVPMATREDFKAIGKVGDGRLVASFGKGAFESKDRGASWMRLTDALDLATAVPPPGVGRCDGRTPGAGEVCPLATVTTTQTSVEAFVRNGDAGLAYLRHGYAVTSDEGFTWEPRVSAAREAEMARHPRTISERTSINSARVRTYGYTEAQYKTLGALVRTLATVFPALSKVAGVDAKGEVIERGLEDPAASPGILAHWHWEMQRWDPGPGFDWSRLVNELSERPR